MKPDMSIEIRRHEADAIQAEAELKRMDAEIKKDAAKQRIDQELGLSSKREEFKQRLHDLRRSEKAKFKGLMNQYKSDWDGFKTDMLERFKRADRLNSAQRDLLEARIDGFNARVQYLVGLAREEDAKEAEAINRSLEPVIKNFQNFSDEVRRAFREEHLESEKEMADYDRRLQEYTQQAEKILLARTPTGTESARRH